MTVFSCPLLGILSLTLLAESQANGQVTDAGILGTVRDSAGMPMIRTLVEAKHAETGYLARVVSGEGGRYAFLGLPLGGPYTVVARRLGFQPLSRAGITLTIGARAVVDFTLESVATQLSGVAVRADASVGRESRTGGSTRVSRVEIEAFSRSRSQFFRPRRTRSPRRGATIVRRPALDIHGHPNRWRTGAQHAARR